MKQKQEHIVAFSTTNSTIFSREKRKTTNSDRFIKERTIMASFHNDNSSNDNDLTIVKYSTHFFFKGKEKNKNK